MADDVVNPMEVFAAMSASLLEKQPKPFNPMYAIKSTPPPPLKIGGKPPREIFYRDTLTFMTTLPPPVQAKTCTCKYLCAGEKATIICHSCSIYDPTKAAYYCSKCFPARHPWYRAPHLHTPIENDESISHTLKIAHRIAEASRYDNEGQDILRKVQNQKPNLAFVADDVKVDDQLRAYGRKVTALEQHVLQLRERLQRDIMFGDVVPVRRSLYSHNTAESITEQGLIKMGDDSSTATPSGQDSDRSELLELGQARYTGPAHRKLELLRREPVFDSEPLFTSLQDDTEGPETLTPPGVGQNVVAGTTGIAVGKPALFIRAPLLRGDTAESTDSMTLSPEGEGGFFRDDSNMNLVRSLGPQLDAIEEADSIVTEGASNKASLQDTATAAAGAMVATESSMHSLADTIASQNEAVGGADANTEKQTAELDSGSRAAYVVGSEYSGDETSVPSPGIKRVLSGLSFTSVAHSEIDSVSVPAAQAQRQAQVQMPSLVSELTLPTIADRGEPQSGKSQSSNWLGSIASVDTSHSGGSAESSSTAAGSIHSYGDVSTLSKSSTNIQRIFKGYLARRTVSKMLTTRLYRVFCLEVNRDYYYDRVTGASSWLPPKLLHADHLEELQYVSEQAVPKYWYCKRSCLRRRPAAIVKKNTAITVLQGLGRCILARRRILQRADSAYRRIYDADSGVYYYANVYLGTTSWTKSSVYLHPSSEPPILQAGESAQAAQAGPGSAKLEGNTSIRRSPRYNRAK